MFRPAQRSTSVLARSFLRVTTRRCLSQDARKKIEEAVSKSPVVLFMKGTPDAPQCGFSRAVTQVLELNEVPPQKIAAYDVLSDQQLRSGIKEFSEWPTIPQVYVNGEFVGGCDILLSMHQSGELATMLRDKGILPKEDETPTEPAPS